MRFSLFRELYIHHRSSCGLGAHRALCPARPAPREPVGAGPPEGGSRAVAGWTLLGGQRLRQRYIQWAQDTASVRALSTTQTSLSHTHTRGSGHSFCMSAWHHRRHTQTHTHTLFTAAHTHIQTHTRLRTQLRYERLAPHRRHTHSSQQCTLTFRILGEPRHVGHREASPPAPPPTLSANSAAEPEPLRMRLLDDVTVHIPGDTGPLARGDARWRAAQNKTPAIGCMSRPPQA